MKKRYPIADSRIVKAELGEHSELCVSLIKGRGAEFTTGPDGTVGKSAKGSKPSDTLLNALGPKAKEVAEGNDELIKSLQEIERIGSQQNKEHLELQQEHDVLNRRLDFINNKLLEAREAGVKRDREIEK